MTRPTPLYVVRVSYAESSYLIGPPASWVDMLFDFYWASSDPTASVTMEPAGEQI